MRSNSTNSTFSKAVHRFGGVLFWGLAWAGSGSTFEVVELGGAPAVATDINDQGLVVGFTSQGGFTFGPKGFVLSKPKARLLGETSAVPWDPGVTFAYPLLQLEWHGVNKAGRLVGSAVLSKKWSPVAPFVDTARYPIIWDRVGEAVALNLPNSVALDVNSAGTIVGSGMTAFRVDQRTNLVDLAPSGLRSATAINDWGVIIGTQDGPESGLRPARWIAGKVDGLPGFDSESELEGSTSARAESINGAGQVVGSIFLSAPEPMTSSSSLGFFWSNGTTEILESANSRLTEALDLNAAGTVVGRFEVNPGIFHAFIYRDGQLTDLNSLIVGDDWVLLEARALNGAGQIVGHGLHVGEPRAFLLNSVLVELTAPLVVTQPVGGRFSEGETVVLKCVAEGTVPLWYQWQRNGQNLDQETNAVLRLMDLDSDDVGIYRAVVSNRVGQTFTEEVSVMLVGPEVSIAQYVGLTITGVVGARYQIEGAPQLAPEDWAVLHTLVLTNSPQRWFDVETSTAMLPRYYRAVQMPPP